MSDFFPNEAIDPYSEQPVEREHGKNKTAQQSIATDNQTSSTMDGQSLIQEANTSSNSVDDDNIDPYSGERLEPTKTFQSANEESSVNAEKSTDNTQKDADGRSYEEYDYNALHRRPRKRKLVGGDKQVSAFSLRNRVNEEDRSREANRSSYDNADDYSNDNSLSQEPEESKPVMPTPSLLSSSATNSSLLTTATDSPAPAWMKPQDVQQERKLKKPKRRTDVDAQARRAQQIREREAEIEQRNLELERQTIAQKQKVDDIVRSHYNQRAHVARNEKRNESQIYKLRNFNNVLKYMLIGKYAKQNDKVLDLACGKGGDLFKWQKACVSLYIGLDISPSSIEEAIKRYQRIKYRNFEAFFATADAFGKSIDEALSIFPPQALQFPVDVVSIQFALHYAFESEEKIRNTLANISSHLKVGGTFIGTIPSSDFIKYKIKSLRPGEKKWGNSIYSVEFLEPPPKNGVWKSPYGNTYIYYLKDAVDHVPEYVVPFESLRSLAEEYDLELRYKKSFFEFYNEEIPHWHNKLTPKLLNGLKRSDGKLGLEGENKQAAEFYLAFAFEKTGYQ